MKPRSEKESFIISRWTNFAIYSQSIDDVVHTLPEYIHIVHYGTRSESTSQQRRKWANAPSNGVDTSIKSNNLITFK